LFFEVKKMNRYSIILKKTPPPPPPPSPRVRTTSEPVTTGPMGYRAQELTGVQGIRWGGETGVQGITGFQGTTGVQGITGTVFQPTPRPETRVTFTVNSSQDNIWYYDSTAFMRVIPYLSEESQTTTNSTRTSYKVTLKEKALAFLNRYGHLPTQWWISDDGEQWKKTSWWKVITQQHKTAKSVKLGLK